MLRIHTLQEAEALVHEAALLLIVAGLVALGETTIGTGGHDHHLLPAAHIRPDGMIIEATVLDPLDGIMIHIQRVRRALARGPLYPESVRFHQREAVAADTKSHARVLIGKNCILIWLAHNLHFQVHTGAIHQRATSETLAIPGTIAVALPLRGAIARSLMLQILGGADHRHQRDSHMPPMMYQAGSRPQPRGGLPPRPFTPLDPHSYLMTDPML